MVNNNSHDANWLFLKLNWFMYKLRAALHYVPWSRIMEEGPFQWSDFLKNLVLKVLGLSLGTNRMWTKKNDHAPKSECVDFYLFIFNTCPKRKKLIKNSSLTILLSSLGLHLSSLLVKCVEDVACKSFHNIFYKKLSDLILYIFNVIYMWYVPCVVTTLNKIFSVCLNFMLLPPYLAQH
jgi:hypothetical protein